jgi:hypothetical protein
MNWPTRVLPEIPAGWFFFYGPEARELYWGQPRLICDMKFNFREGAPAAFKLTADMELLKNRFTTYTSSIVPCNKSIIPGGDPLEPPVAFGSVIYGTFEESRLTQVVLYIAIPQSYPDQL